jgi:DNA repair and recombination protein RAD52
MSFTADQKTELAKPLDKKHVKPPAPGKYGEYVEGWHVIAEANRIFGFDGWARETVSMIETNRELLTLKDRNGADFQQWRVGYVAKVRVTACGITREGTGFGSGMDKPEALGTAIESAVKEAETDAMKRALMTFGMPFGLALYDKSKANVAEAPDPALSGHLEAIGKATTLESLQNVFGAAWKAIQGVGDKATLKARYEARKIELTPAPKTLGEHLDNLQQQETIQ